MPGKDKSHTGKIPFASIVREIRPVSWPSLLTTWMSSPASATSCGPRSYVGLLDAFGGSTISSRSTASARLLRISISNKAAGILLSALLPRIKAEQRRVYPVQAVFGSKRHTISATG